MIPQDAFIPVLVVVIATLIAAITDIWKFRVYNALTFPLLITGILFHTYRGGMTGFWASLLGMLFGFGILIVFYVMGGVSAGDVKLLAAVGAWLGVRLTFYVFVASSLVQGIYAVALIVYTGRVGETLLNLAIAWHKMSMLGRHLLPEERVETEIRRADRRRRVVPFAAMMSLGFLATLWWFWGGRGVEWPSSSGAGKRPASSPTDRRTTNANKADPVSDLRLPAPGARADLVPSADELGPTRVAATPPRILAFDDPTGAPRR